MSYQAWEALKTSGKTTVGGMGAGIVFGYIQGASRKGWGTDLFRQHDPSCELWTQVVMGWDTND